MKNLIMLLLITIVGVSCDKSDEPIIDNTSALDKLFTSGFDMSLEQVYIMSATNTIPYMDYPTDSCFKTVNDIVTINNFQNYNDTTKLLSAIVKGENWNISKMITKTDTTYVEHGFNSNYYIDKNTNTNYYNIIKCNNDYTNRVFIISYVVGDVYTPRGRDNHTFNMNYVDLSTNIAYKTNLYFEVLTKDGNGLFNGGKY